MRGSLAKRVSICPKEVAVCVYQYMGRRTNETGKKLSVFKNCDSYSIWHRE